MNKHMDTLKDERRWTIRQEDPETLTDNGAEIVLMNHAEAFLAAPIYGTVVPICLPGESICPAGHVAVSIDDALRFVKMAVSHIDNPAVSAHIAHELGKLLSSPGDDQPKIDPVKFYGGRCDGKLQPKSVCGKCGGHGGWEGGAAWNECPMCGGSGTDDDQPKPRADSEGGGE